MKDVSEVDFGKLAHLREACLNGGCGAFAYVLSRLIGGDIVIYGDHGGDPWYTLSGLPPQYQVARLKWDYFRHVLVRIGNNLYDVRGVVSAESVRDEFGSNGYCVITREKLRKKMDQGRYQPLHYHPELVTEISAILGPFPDLSRLPS